AVVVSASATVTTSGRSGSAPLGWIWSRSGRGSDHRAEVTEPAVAAVVPPARDVLAAHPHRHRTRGVARELRLRAARADRVASRALARAPRPARDRHRVLAPLA